MGAGGGQRALRRLSRRKTLSYLLPKLISRQYSELITAPLLPSSRPPALPSDPPQHHHRLFLLSQVLKRRRALCRGIMGRWSHWLFELELLA